MADNSRKQAALAPAYAQETHMFSMTVPAGSQESLFFEIKTQVKLLNRGMPLGVELLVYNSDPLNYSSDVDLLFDPGLSTSGLRLPHCNPTDGVQALPFYFPIFGKPDPSIYLSEQGGLLDAVIMVCLLY